MFAAYYDASKSNGGIVLSVGGFISSLALWRDYFASAWRSHLNEYDLTYFHMKDYTASRKEYEKFKGDEPQREQFMKGLIGVIKGGVQYGIGRIVPMRDFETIDGTYRLSEKYRNAYCLAGLECMRCARRLVDKLAIVDYVFDEGDQGKGHLQDLAQEDGFPMPSFRSSRDRKGASGLLPLQAADLVAYELSKGFSENLGARLIQWRKSFQSLTQIDSSWKLLDLKWLRLLCEREGIPKRK
jgi:hypothetical protein